MSNKNNYIMYNITIRTEDNQMIADFNGKLAEKFVNDTILNGYGKLTKFKLKNDTIINGVKVTEDFTFTMSNNYSSTIKLWIFKGSTISIFN